MEGTDGIVEWLRRRLTYANVAATVALFVGLGGTSYAAFSLPANSVGSKQLKKGSVTPAKVNRATAALFKGQQGPKGDQGGPGPQGDRGAQGIQGSKGDTGPSDGYFSQNLVNDPTWPGHRSIDITLPAGSFVITGKVQAFDDSSSSQNLGCYLVDANSWGLGGNPISPTYQYLTVWDSSGNFVPGQGYATDVVGTAQTFAAASTTVRLTCDGYDGSGGPPLLVGQAWLRAVKVGALH